MPIAFPPPVLVGSAVCVRDGDTLPLVVPPRSLPAGIDSRCYVAGQLPVPCPVADLLLLPAAVANQDAGFPVFTWPDGSLAVSSPANYDPSSAPLASSAAGLYPALQFTPAAGPALPSALPLASPVSLSGDYLFSATFLLPSAGLGTGSVFLGTGTGGPLLAVSASAVTVQGAAGPVSFPTGLNTDQVHTFLVTLGNGTLAVYRDSVLVGSQVNAPPPQILVSGLVGYDSAFLAPASLLLIDVRLYGQTVVGPCLTQLLAALLAAYPAPAPAPAGCYSCRVVPNTWSLMVAGYTGAAAGLNGTWTLAWQGSCVWAASAGGFVWTLAAVADNAYSLDGSAVGIDSLFLSPGVPPWHCVGQNVLFYSSGTGDSGHPLSLTVLAV